MDKKKKTRKQKRNYPKKNTENDNSENEDSIKKLKKDEESEQSKKKEKIKKRIKKYPKRYLTNENSESEEAINNKEKEINNNNETVKKSESETEEGKWIDTLIYNMKNYDVELYSDKLSSSDTENDSQEKLNNQIGREKDSKDESQKCKDENQKGESIAERKIDTVLNVDFTQSSKLKIFSKDLIIFDGKEYKNFPSANKYNNKRKIKKIIYKCKYWRKDEKLRSELNQKPFCEATIEYIEPQQKLKSGYFFKKDHSLECDIFYGKEKSIIKNELKKKEDKELFIEKCHNIMNSSNIYDRSLFKDSFKKLYNDPDIKYDFPINNNLLSNIITKWKNNTYRFKKECIIYDTRDYENRLILRDFRFIPLENDSKSKINSLEYIIWGNAENIMRLKVTKNLFIDGTFHHPPGYYQLLIIMYKDIITDLKIPGLYILLNSKKEILYDLVFESLVKIIFDNNMNKLTWETIVTDQELALVNSIKKYFPKCKRISCLFHYKQDILRNLKSYGLYKKSSKLDSDNLLDALGRIPFIYKGDMKIFESEIKKLSNEYPKYVNFINNYILGNKKTYFEDGSLDYSKVPKDCRSNSFLENYNGFIKSKLGKYRIINWVNFMNFLKEESQRSITKLYNATSSNLKNKDFKEQLMIKNPFTFSDNYKTILDKSTSKSNLNLSISTKGNIIDNNEFSKTNFLKILISKMGLTNLGNTCYMNSALQILLHTELLIHKIIDYKGNTRFNIIDKFINLGLEIIKSEFSENLNYIVKSYSPIEFKKAFDNLHPLFKTGQQDSIEFIRFFLSDISKETNISCADYEEFNYLDLSKSILSVKFNEHYLRRENSIVTDLYYTQLINIFKCPCGKETYSFQKIIDIPLLIPFNNREFSLETLIEYFLMEIHVDLNDLCINCKKKRGHIKKSMKLDILNHFIIFSIQRKDPLSSIKNTSFINFDETICLKKFIVEPKPDNSYNYKLFATIHHLGNINEGHYYSLINVENKWFEFNDSIVSPLEHMIYNSSNVCVLFYKKLN